MVCACHYVCVCGGGGGGGGRWGAKSVYPSAFHDLELLRYVLNSILRCTLMYKIERLLYFPAGMNKVYCYGIPTTKPAPGRLFGQTMGIFKQHLESNGSHKDYWSLQYDLDCLFEQKAEDSFRLFQQKADDSIV